MLRVQQWVKELLNPPKSHPGELNGAGNAAFPMTSSGNGGEGGKTSAGISWLERGTSRCGILPFVWQQTAPREEGSTDELQNSLGSPEMSSSPP